MGYYYVDSFRKCELYKWQTSKEATMLQIAIYNIMYVNDLGCSCIVDMSDKVYDQDKETKKIFGALAKRQRAYEREVTKILGEHIGVLAEYNSEMDDKVKDKVANLYSALYKFFHQNNIENAKFIAYAELTYTIIEYSVNSIEKRVSECLKYNKDVVNLRQYKMLGMRDVSRNLCKWLGRKCNGLNLNDCQEIKDAYHELDKVLTNISVIKNAISKAEELKNVV